MPARATLELDAEQCREVAAWIAANREGAPASVRTFLDLHQTYLAVGEGDPLRRALEAAWRELRRAFRLTPSSEKRRTSGRPLGGLPEAAPLPKKSGERERLEARLARGHQLAEWHGDQKKRHDRHIKKIEKRMAKMQKEKTIPAKLAEELSPLDELDDPQLTEEQRAAEKAESEAAVQRFLGHVQEGGCADPAMRLADETLMPGNAAIIEYDQVDVPAQVPEGLAEAPVVKTLCEARTRYDFAVTVTSIELDVEKKVLVDSAGERHVITGSTSEWGPARFQVTWSALATLSTLVGQYALPLNRLGTMLSSPEKKFTAASLGRMLHYVAERLVPIYLELASQLASSDYLAGDDTSCRVLELSAWFEKARSDPAAATKEKPPWSSYATPSAAEESLRLCEQLRRDRIPPPRRRRS